MKINGNKFAGILNANQTVNAAQSASYQPTQAQPIQQPIQQPTPQPTPQPAPAPEPEVTITQAEAQPAPDKMMSLRDRIAKKREAIARMKSAAVDVQVEEEPIPAPQPQPAPTPQPTPQPQPAAQPARHYYRRRSSASTAAPASRPTAQPAARQTSTRPARHAAAPATTLYVAPQPIDPSILKELGAIYYIKNYTENSDIIFGDTKPIKEYIKKLGCKFNPSLHPFGPNESTQGWFFSTKLRDRVTEYLGNLLQETQRVKA
jgi:hypothetical protein